MNELASLLVLNTYYIFAIALIYIILSYIATSIYCKTYKPKDELLCYHFIFFSGLLLPFIFKFFQKLNIKFIFKTYNSNFNIFFHILAIIGYIVVILFFLKSILFYQWFIFIRYKVIEIPIWLFNLTEFLHTLKFI